MNLFMPVTKEDYKECAEHQTEIIETKLGAVECAMRGEGPILLAVHGGGCEGMFTTMKTSLSVRFGSAVRTVLVLMTCSSLSR